MAVCSRAAASVDLLLQRLASQLIEICRNDDERVLRADTDNRDVFDDHRRHRPIGPRCGDRVETLERSGSPLRRRSSKQAGAQLDDVAIAVSAASRGARRACRSFVPALIPLLPRVRDPDDDKCGSLDTRSHPAGWQLPCRRPADALREKHARVTTFRRLRSPHVVTMAAVLALPPRQRRCVSCTIARQ